MCKKERTRKRNATRSDLELSKSEQNILDFLSDNEMHIDAIVEGLGWGFSKVANELLQAECKGLILSLPGKIYNKNI